MPIFPQMPDLEVVQLIWTGPGTDHVEKQDRGSRRGWRRGGGSTGESSDLR